MKKISLLLCLCLLLYVLTGCYNCKQRATINISRDGKSFNEELIFLTDSSLASLESSVWGLGLVIRKYSDSNNFNYDQKSYSEGDYKGDKYLLYNCTISDVEISSDGVVSLNIPINTDLLVEIKNLDYLQVTEEDECRIIVKAPYKITNTNAPIVSSDGKTAEYDLLKEKYDIIHIEYKLPFIANLSYQWTGTIYYFYVVFTVILIALAVLLIVLLIKKKKKKQTVSITNIDRRTQDTFNETDSVQTYNLSKVINDRISEINECGNDVSKIRIAVARICCEERIERSAEAKWLKDSCISLENDDLFMSTLESYITQKEENE